MNTPAEKNRLKQSSLGFHLFARSVGFLALLTAVLYLWAALDRGLLAADNESWSQTAGLALLSLLFLATLGLLGAFRWEGIGGVVALLCGIGLGLLVYLTAEGGRGWMTFAYSSPFIIAGGLYFLCWWRERRPA